MINVKQWEELKDDMLDLLLNPEDNELLQAVAWGYYDFLGVPTERMELTPFERRLEEKITECKNMIEETLQVNLMEIYLKNR